MIFVKTYITVIYYTYYFIMNLLLYCFVHSDASSGYQYKRESSIMTDGTVNFAQHDVRDVVDACVEIISAGADSQGAAVQSRTDPDTVAFNVFELESPNLVDVTDGIAVTARATGE